MSKTPKSASRSRSRSASRSPPYSRSRSRSQSRHRKRRYSSRSHSRSRSHSPTHSRERNYTREYQNNREFRGFRGSRRPFFRGRGRGYFPRGRFQRGRGGNFNNYRNNWHNNGNNHYRQQQQQQQQQQHNNYNNHNNHNNSCNRSPKRGRCRSPKKRSGSPRSRSYSDESARRSRSHHSYSSSSSSSSRDSSRNSSKRRRSGSRTGKRKSKHVKEVEHVSREVSKGTEGGNGVQGEHGGDGGGGEVAPEMEAEVGQGAEVGAGAGAGARAEAEEEELMSGGWREVTLDCTTPSPLQASPLLCVSVAGGQGTLLPASQKSPSPKCTIALSNGASVWQGAGGAASVAKTPPKKSPTPTSTGFGFMPKENRGDDQAMSSAFKKFLEEQKSKQASVFENGEEDGAEEDSTGIRERGGGGGCKTTSHMSVKGQMSRQGQASISSSKFSNHNGRAAREKFSYEDFTVNASRSSFSDANGPVFRRDRENGEERNEDDEAEEEEDDREEDDDEENVEEEEEEEEEEVLTISPRKKAGKEAEIKVKVKSDAPSASKHKKDHGKKSPAASSSSSMLSARQLFDLALFRASQDDGDLELLEEQLFPNRKQERVAAVAAALMRREMAGMLKGAIASKKKAKAGGVGRKKEKMADASVSAASSSSSTSLASNLRAQAQLSQGVPGESWDVGAAVAGKRDKAPLSREMAGKKGVNVNVRLDSLNKHMSSIPSSLLESERQLDRDVLHSSKKEEEVHTVFKGPQDTHVCRCSSDGFSRHIVTIVHNVKAQHFPSSGMTLTERFAMYQRRAAEKEIVKARKSPEIHRRIDVSPSAFKKHAHLFEEMKDLGESSYKAKGKKTKSSSSNGPDLRQDIERRKKGRSSRETEGKRGRGRGSGESSDSSRERSTEKASKRHHKHKKSKKKRERSRSSSSSSSSSSHSNRAEEHPKDRPSPKEKAFVRARLGPREQGGPMERGQGGPMDRGQGGGMERGQGGPMDRGQGGPLERGRGRGGFQLRIRGRAWNRGNLQNNSNGNGPGMGGPMHNMKEDRDPEYTPKSKTYYLHDDREGERERRWMENRGRGRGSFVRSGGRFLFRKAVPTSTASAISSSSSSSTVTTVTSSIAFNNNNSSHISPKWTHDKFPGSAEEEGEVKDEEEDQVVKGDGDVVVVSMSSGQ